MLWGRLRSRHHRRGWRRRLFADRAVWRVQERWAGHVGVTGGGGVDDEPDPVTAPVVKRIFAEHVAGRGMTTIARGPTQDGIPCPPPTIGRAPTPQYRGLGNRRHPRDPAQPAVYRPTGLEPVAHRRGSHRRRRHGPRPREPPPVEQSERLGLVEGRGTCTGRLGRPVRTGAEHVEDARNGWRARPATRRSVRPHTCSAA